MDSALRNGDANGRTDGADQADWNGFFLSDARIFSKKIKKNPF